MCILNNVQTHNCANLFGKVKLRLFWCSHQTTPQHNYPKYNLPPTSYTLKTAAHSLIEKTYSLYKKINSDQASKANNQQNALSFSLNVDVDFYRRL